MFFESRVLYLGECQTAGAKMRMAREAVMETALMVVWRIITLAALKQGGRSKNMTGSCCNQSKGN
jgi:hypothetical protein